MTEDKNSNTIILGLGLVAAMFFAYLIYMSRKEETKINQQPQSYQQSQIQPYIQPTQQIDYNLLYELQKQTYQLADSIKLQNDQLQSVIQVQNKQSESISSLESIKCSNIVSMNNQNIQDSNNTKNFDDIINTSNNNYSSNTLNKINKLKNRERNFMKSLSNTGRENDELIAHNIFGML